MLHINSRDKLHQDAGKLVVVLHLLISVSSKLLYYQMFSPCLIMQLTIVTNSI